MKKKFAAPRTSLSFSDISDVRRLSYTPTAGAASWIGTWQHFALVAKTGDGGYTAIYRNGLLGLQVSELDLSNLVPNSLESHSGD